MWSHIFVSNVLCFYLLLKISKKQRNWKYYDYYYSPSICNTGIKVPHNFFSEDCDSKGPYFNLFTSVSIYLYSIFQISHHFSLPLKIKKKLLVTGNRAQISRKCNLAINAVLKYTAWFVDKYFFNACNYWISRINVVMSL